MSPDTIMIFAAGHGTRMRHLTHDKPKPLIEVAGTPLIDHALDLAEQAGISRAIVNTHYLGEMIAAHLKDRANVTISPEVDQALETGGGLKHAIPLIGEETVFTLNPDTIFTGQNPLRQLASAWQPDRMDALLMLIPLDSATGHEGTGDFALNPEDKLSRFIEGGQAPLVNTGAQIIKSSLLADIPDTRFSQNVVWDRLIAQGRLAGTVHSGNWADVGTPEGIVLAEEMLRTL